MSNKLKRQIAELGPEMWIDTHVHRRGTFRYAAITENFGELGEFPNERQAKRALHVYVQQVLGGE